MSEIKAGKLQAGISVTPANNFVLDPSADDGTLILRDSSGTALATLASGGEAELYARGNILGTVSESAGVPTGAIVEVGSNANGDYTKFADGTLICRFQSTTTETTNLTAVAPIYTLTTTPQYDFPHEFAAGNPIVVNANFTTPTNAHGWCNISIIATTHCKFQGFSTTNTATANPAYVAIGRWY